MKLFKKEHKLTLIKLKRLFPLHGGAANSRATRALLSDYEKTACYQRDAPIARINAAIDALEIPVPTLGATRSSIDGTS